MRVKNHPSLGEWIRSTVLAWKIRTGRVQRGRTVPKATWYQEFCLRCRTLRAAAGFFCKQPIFGGIAGGGVFPVGRLSAVVTRSDGTTEDLGLLATKLVTTAGVNYMAAAFNAGGSVNLFKFHGSGTGGTAENVSDTALVTEVETRATGSQANSTNTYTTVGTVTYTATRAVVEHGLFSASSAGTLLDRSVFSAINVGSGDSIQFTYVLTLPSGG